MESGREQYVRTRTEMYRLRAEVERLRAEIASKDRLLPSLLAEGKAVEQARAERAEARATKLRDSCQELLEIVQTRHGSLYSDAQERAERAIAEGRS